MCSVTSGAGAQCARPYQSQLLALQSLSAFVHLTPHVSLHSLIRLACVFFSPTETGSGLLDAVLAAGWKVAGLAAELAVAVAVAAVVDAEVAFDEVELAEAVDGQAHRHC